MNLGGSYSYFFNYLNEQYPKHQVLKCFELQMPVKEVIFRSLDKKYYPFGEVESFILKAIHSLEIASVSELNYIFHLGQKNIEHLLLDFIELDVLVKNDEYYSLKNGALNLIDYSKKPDKIYAEHSILYDVLLTKSEVLLDPVKRDRYKRSVHNYNYPTELNRFNMAYNPISLGTRSISIEDIQSLISLPDIEKEELNISPNIIEIKEILNVNNFSHPIRYVLLLDKKGNEVLKVFDACTSESIQEISKQRVITFNLEYLKHVRSGIFGEITKDQILKAFRKSDGKKYTINEKDIMSLRPPTVKVSGEAWVVRASSGFWYDYESGLVIYLYPNDNVLANSILNYKILYKLETANNQNLLNEELLRSITRDETKMYQERLSNYGDVKVEIPEIEKLFESAIRYKFNKLSSDMQDILDL
jgi:peptidoglycan hydrolase-like protein with peptidoglycan-binding domain